MSVLFWFLHIFSLGSFIVSWSMGVPILPWIMLFVFLYLLKEDALVFMRGRNCVRYTGQTFEELKDHLKHFVVRAYSDAEMYLEIENSSKRLRIRKNSKPKIRENEFFVIFEGVTEENERSSRLRRSLVRCGFKGRCKFGTHIIFSRGQYRHLLVCTCQSLEEIICSIRKSFEKFYEVSENSMFTLYIKGGVEDGYVYRDSKTTFNESIAPICENKWARPYLQHQVKPHKKYNCGPKGEHLG